MNKPVIVISVIVILILLGVGAAWFLMRTPPSADRSSFFGNLPFIGGGPTPPPPAATPPAPTPTEIERRLIQVVDKDILAPALSADGNSLLYVLRENGHVMRSGLDGSNEQIATNLTVLETFDGLWSPLKTKLAIAYHESGAVKRFLLETATATPSKFLPQDLTALAWSPDGKEIAYLIPQGNQTNLVIADQNGKNGKVVFSTPIPDFTLQWISKSTMLLVSRPSGLAPSIVMRFDIKTKKSDLVLAGRRGGVVTAAPDASGFVFSQSNSRDGRAEPLALHSFKDGNVSLIRYTTIAEKCAFSADGKKLYCGVPKGTLPAPMPDEWYKGAVSFSDAIVEIDAATSQTKTLLENEADVDLISPFVSPDGKYLFFQNKKDGTLWRLMLKE